MISINGLLERADVVRLQKMRDKKSTPKINILIPGHHDNFLFGAIQAISCMRRIKRAGLIGRYYWITAKMNGTTEEYLMVSDAQLNSSQAAYNTNAPYMKMMQKDPNLANGLDFAQVGIGLGLDLENFSSFLANSVKEKMRGSYILRKRQSAALDGPMDESGEFQIPIFIEEGEDEQSEDGIDYTVYQFSEYEDTPELSKPKHDTRNPIEKALAEQPVEKIRKRGRKAGALIQQINPEEVLSALMGVQDLSEVVIEKVAEPKKRRSSKGKSTCTELAVIPKKSDATSEEAPKKAARARKASTTKAKADAAAASNNMEITELAKAKRKKARA